MRRLFLIGTLLTGLAAAAPAAGTSVIVYGAPVQADLSVLNAAAPTLPSPTLVCNTFKSGCDTSQLTWSRLSDDGTGNVKNLSDGTMDAEGWMLADQIIRISGVADNEPGWVVDLYTENLVGHPTPYTGPFVNKGSVNGLVSSNGQFLIPLSWVLTSDTNYPTMAEQVDAFVHCGLVKRGEAGWCDFATHFMADKGDAELNTPTLNPLYRPAWWQAILTDPVGQFKAKNYQSPLSNDGAANNEFYRQPFSTLSGIGTFYLYVGARFAKGIIRDTYRTTIYLDIVTR